MKHTVLSIVVATSIVLCAGGLVFAELPSDQMTTVELPEPSPNWVFALDSGYPSAMISRINIIDGSSRKLLGQLNGGYLANFEISPDHREMYMIDTYYSRGWHGTRTDVVSIFDAKSLKYTGEVEIPPKRLLIVPKRDSAAITPDGRFLFVANMTPATSVSVVDLKSRKFAGEIDITGCSQVLVGGNRRFASMCADGSILTVDLDDAGKLKSRRQSKPLFDPNNDPIMDQPAMIGSKAYFVSYHGMILPVDISGEQAAAEPAWSILGDTDKSQSWKPGGWQAITAERKTGRLFVLMHKGGEWTHKQTGTEVWIFDSASKKRVGRIKLKTEGYSILASQGDNPLLVNLSLVQSQFETYSIPEGKYQGVFPGLGTDFLIYGP
ncbi:MAG TPA: amine dehydrogenase large subunit [Candidatus Binataceae bacterium]